MGADSLKKPGYAIEWKLLVFLVLLLDVKLAVKGLAIAYVYFVQPDFNFGIKARGSRLPLFYLIITAIGVFNFLKGSNYSPNYLLVVFTGVLIWIACFLVVHQLKLFVEKTEISVLHNTIFVFFIVNILFSVLNLFAIWTEIGFRNPFLYQGLFQKYFINSGDFIKGISFDTSTTNAVVNCFGIIYFIFRRNYPFVLACMITLLLTGSNYCNIILSLILLFIFIWRANREQKSIIAVCFMLLIVFMTEISPQNDNYLISSVNKYILRKPEDLSIHTNSPPLRERPDNLLTNETRNEKIAILYLDSLERIQLSESGFAVMTQAGLLQARHEIPQDRIHTASFQWSRDTTAFQRILQRYLVVKNIRSGMPITSMPAGKVQAFRQSLLFLKEHHDKIFFGNGIGNFSSSLAYRATGLKIAGGFPAALTYTNPDFLSNHFSLYAFFASKCAESHSIIHNSASVFDQLMTEYGFLGLFGFAFYYLGYFLRNMNKLSYGFPMLGLLISVFLIDYWFERLSIVVLFELLYFIDIKDHHAAAV
jgi:hypothetical protein